MRGRPDPRRVYLRPLPARERRLFLDGRMREYTARWRRVDWVSSSVDGKLCVVSDPGHPYGLKTYHVLRAHVLEAFRVADGPRAAADAHYERSVEAQRYERCCMMPAGGAS